MTTGLASLKVEIAAGQDPMTTVTPSWTDVTASVQSITTNRGRDEQWQPHSPGTASFTFTQKQSSIFYPNTTSLSPNTPIRASIADSTSSRQYLFAGFINPNTNLEFDFNYKTGTTTVEAYDALGVLAVTQLPALKIATSDPQTFTDRSYGWQTSGAAILALDAAYTLFPAWQTESVGVGQTILQDFALGTDALSVIQKIVQAEGGAFYASRAGDLIFDDRYAPFTTSNLATSQITFDEAVVAGNAQFATNFTMWQPPIYTSAAVMMDGCDETFSFSYAPEVATFGTRAYPAITNAIMGSSTEAKQLAERLVMTSNNLGTCPHKIRIYPTRSNTLLDCAVNRELRERCVFKSSTAQIAAGANVQIERIEHQINVAQKSWTTDYAFSSRDQLTFWYDLTDPHWFVIGDATKGLLSGARRLAW